MEHDDLTPQFDSPEHLESTSTQPSTSEIQTPPTTPSSVNNGEILPPTEHLDQVSKPKRKLNFTFKKISIIAGIILVLIPGIGIASYSAYKGDTYWLRDLVGKGIPKDPTEAVKKSIEKMANLKSYESSTNSSFSATVLESDFSFKLTSEDKVNNSDELVGSVIKIKDFTFPEEDDMPPAVKDLNGASGEAEIIASKEQVYFKTPALNDKWYIIDPASLSVPTSAFKNQDFAKDFQAVAGASVQNDGFQTTSFEDMSKSIKSAQRLEDDSIGKSPAYHYKIEVDILKVLEENENFKDVPGFQLEVIKAFISKYITFNSEVWISKKDFSILKQATKFDIKADAKDFGQEGIYKFKMESTISYSNFDQNININKPEGAEAFDENTILELVALMQAETPQEAEMLKHNLKRDQDMQLVKGALEKYYEKNSAYPVATDDSADGTFLQELIENSYLEKQVKDPLHPEYYYLYVSEDGLTYSLTVAMETPDGDLIVDFGAAD